MRACARRSAARRTGRVPPTVTADRGYGQAAVERDLHAAGVRTVAIPREATTSAAARCSSTAAASASWSNGEPAAKAGSATSNTATAGTVPAWTAEREAIWCGHGVFAHNLVKIAILAS